MRGEVGLSGCRARGRIVGNGLGALLATMEMNTVMAFLGASLSRDFHMFGTKAETDQARREPP